MKKVYVKPEIIFESFSLSTNIAGDCGVILGTPSEGTCAYVGTGNIAVFTGSVEACVFTPTDMGMENDDTYDGFCYHVPNDANDLFNS